MNQITPSQKGAFIQEMPQQIFFFFFPLQGHVCISDEKARLVIK